MAVYRGSFRNPREAPSPPLCEKGAQAGKHDLGIPCKFLKPEALHGGLWWGRIVLCISTAMMQDNASRLLFTP